MNAILGITRPGDFGADSFCHGNQGEGGHEGVPLTAITDAQSIRRIVIEGRNRMPAFGALLTPEQIQDLVAFVADRLPNQLR